MIPRLPLPHFIERNRDTVVSCPLYEDGELASPPSCTVVVTDENGDTMSSGSGVVVGGVMVYTIAGTDTADESLSDSWSVVWSFDGLSPMQNLAYLVRRVLPCMVVSADLIRAHRSLGTQNYTSTTDWSETIAEAWVIVQNRLMAEGRRPELVVEPSALRGVVLSKSLELAFRSLGTYTESSPMLQAEADRYRSDYAEQWSQLRLRYDADEDGSPSPSSEAGSTTSFGTLWL